MRGIKEEGFDARHDDGHKDQELAMAAVCYALPPFVRELIPMGQLKRQSKNYASRFWPFEMKWWKPKPHDRVRELVIAGALIAAEIDRIRRIELMQAKASGNKTEIDRLNRGRK